MQKTLHSQFVLKEPGDYFAITATFNLQEVAKGASGKNKFSGIQKKRSG